MAAAGTEKNARAREPEREKREGTLRAAQRWTTPKPAAEEEAVSR